MFYYFCILGVGNSLAHENPFVLTMNLLFFKWHNHLAEIICSSHKNWNDSHCFMQTRKWVIATLQVSIKTYLSLALENSCLIEKIYVCL